MRVAGLLAITFIIACAIPTRPQENSPGCDLCGGQVCVDLENDPSHCGDCSTTCTVLEACIQGACVYQGEPCPTAGTMEVCYGGAADTLGVGPCKAGNRICQDNLRWGTCVGEVRPTGEICGNQIDDNCNGEIDEDVDLDGDGFSTCDRDCCDSMNDGCASPELVNPGAFEVEGNMLDDDCDGIVDEASTAACDSGLASNATNPLDYARAMELCQTTTATDPQWGVISARFTLADGTGAPAAKQHSIRPAFGATTVRGGSSLVVLSTRAAAATGQTNPNFEAFQPGGNTGMESTSGFPADWLAANNGALPNAPGCPAPRGTLAHDPIMLELVIRVPTNARSFSLSSNFFTAEYPEWVCSAYSDFFVALLDSTWNGQPANPPDKNLARYVSATNQVYPIGVNLAYGNTGLFRVCKNGDTGCTPAANAGVCTTCNALGELIGTGFDVKATGPMSKCGSNDLVGGGTGWLVTTGNVVGGELIKLRFAVWDTSDALVDSLVLLDNFQWSVEASEPGTTVIIF
jgi:hypothetical protein